MGVEAIVVFFVAGFVFVFGAVMASKLMAPRSDNPSKWEPYESGMETIGPSWIQFKVGYYLFAILFLIFDVEVAFLVPWAVAFKSVGMVAFVEILIFFVVLGIGLLYAWKKQALRWE